MFEHNLMTPKHFTSKADGREAYKDFLLKVGLKEGEYPYETKLGKRSNGKQAYLRVTSWGGYVNADNEWRIFISAIDSESRFTKFISWSWNSTEKCVDDMKVNTWLP